MSRRLSDGDSPKFHSVPYAFASRVREKNVFEKREAIVNQRPENRIFLSSLIASRSSIPFDISAIFLPSPLFHLLHALEFFFPFARPSWTIDRCKTGIGQLFARFGRKGAKVHRFGDELPSLLLLLANLHSNAINVNRSASGHVETAPNSSLLEQPFAQRPRIIPPS